MHEVTVQGNKVDALKRASGSGTTIGQREIRNAQPQSAAELLSRVPGMQVRTEDPMGFRLNLGVRGLSPARSRLILMEEDGVPVVVSPYGEPELYYTPMVERIEHIDVLKGSDVLRYGPQTVGRRGAAAHLGTDRAPGLVRRVSSRIARLRLAGGALLEHHEGRRLRGAGRPQIR